MSVNEKYVAPLTGIDRISNRDAYGPETSILHSATTIFGHEGMHEHVYGLFIPHSEFGNPHSVFAISCGRQ